MAIQKLTLAAMISSILILSLCSVSLADNVPVLMWSPSRPLSDLPLPFVGNTIDHKTFQTSYLNPLATTKNNHIVLFLQDKLNVDDFAKYADIYNPYSDGGAFKNIKGLMDDHFSVQLPGVKTPQVALDSLKTEYKGRQHIVKSPSDIAGLKLDDKSYLILVVLPDTKSASSEEKAFAKSDGIVNEVVKELKKREVKYTALFTGQSSQQKPVASIHTGRRLLGENTTTSIFVNVTNDEGAAMYFYARKITLYKTMGKQTLFNLTLPYEKDDYNTSKSSIGNTTGVFSMEYNDVSSDKNDLDIKIRFELSLTQSFRLVISNFTLKLKNSSEEIEEYMDVRNLELDFPAMFSYHCSAFNILQRNRTQTAPYYRLNIDGFQFQAFTRREQFGHAWDCVTFFSTAIWMALFYGFIFIAILYYGMYMMFNLSTMDRFDDPKGKSITVNVNE